MSTQNISAKQLQISSSGGISASVGDSLSGLLLDLDDLTAGSLSASYSFGFSANTGDTVAKKATFTELGTFLAGASNGGIAASAGALSIDLNELTDAALNPAADSIAFLDADGNATRKESWADIMLAIDGNGLSASSGVLAIQTASANALEVGTSGIDLKSTIVGSRTFSNDITISGDLTVNGTTTYISTANLEVEDHYIRLNVSGAASTTAGAGISIVSGSSNAEHGYLKTDSSTSGSWNFKAPASEAVAKLAPVGNGTISVSGSLDISGSSNINQDVRTSASPAFAGLDINGSTTIGSSGGDNHIFSGSTYFYSTVDFDGGITMKEDTSIIGQGALTMNATAGALNVSSSAGVVVSGSSITINSNSTPQTDIDLSADSVYFLDSDGTMKTETFANYATDLASTNSGLAASGGSLIVSASAVAAETIAVASDTFMFFDSDGSVKEESISDLVALQAGAGVSASNGTFVIVSVEDRWVSGSGITGSGMQVVTMSQTPKSAAALSVFSNGMLLSSNCWSVSGKVLTLTAANALELGSELVIKYIQQ